MNRIINHRNILFLKEVDLVVTAALAALEVAVFIEFREENELRGSLGDFSVIVCDCLHIKQFALEENLNTTH